MRIQVFVGGWGGAGWSGGGAGGWASEAERCPTSESLIYIYMLSPLSEYSSLISDILDVHQQLIASTLYITLSRFDTYI